MLISVHIDNRRGSCWRRVVDGNCEAAAPSTLLRQECCCSVGLAWGSPCEPCEPEHCPCAKGFAKVRSNYYICACKKLIREQMKYI